MIIIENNIVGGDVKKWSAPGTSLAVQWLRLHLPMQGVQVWSPVGELSLAAKHKSKQDYNKFNKDFKNGPYHKILKKKKKIYLRCFF